MCLKLAGGVPRLRKQKITIGRSTISGELGGLVDGLFAFEPDGFASLQITPQAFFFLASYSVG